MNNCNSLSTPDSDLQHAIVLVVDDNPATNEFLVQTLSPYYRVFSAQSGEDAIGFCAMHAPDLVILDLHMPVLNGLMTCKLLKSIPKMQHCPIIFSTADTSTEQEINCWDAGATDFVNKPFIVQTLIKRIKAHVQAKIQNDLIENMVFIDQETGLYNRRYFNIFYDKQVALAQRNHGPLSIVIFEITKSDELESQTSLPAASGIQAKYLRKLAELISKKLSRPTDTLVRYSESEFAVLLPDTYIFGAKHIIKKVLGGAAQFKSADENVIFKHIEIAAGMASLEALQKNNNLIDLVEKNLSKNKLTGHSTLSRYNIN